MDLIDFFDSIASLRHRAIMNASYIVTIAKENARFCYVKTRPLIIFLQMFTFLENETFKLSLLYAY